MGTVIIVILVLAFFLLSFFMKRLDTLPSIQFVYLILTIAILVIAILDRSWLPLVPAVAGIFATIRSFRKVRQLRSGGS